MSNEVKKFEVSSLSLVGIRTVLWWLLRFWKRDPNKALPLTSVPLSISLHAERTMGYFGDSTIGVTSVDMPFVVSFFDALRYAWQDLREYGMARAIASLAFSMLQVGSVEAAFNNVRTALMRGNGQKVLRLPSTVIVEDLKENELLHWLLNNSSLYPHISKVTVELDSRYHRSIKDLMGVVDDLKQMFPDLAGRIRISVDLGHMLDAGILLENIEYLAMHHPYSLELKPEIPGKFR